MKTLLLSSLLVLSGCSLWMAPYDTNEYKLVNQVRTIAQLEKCDKDSITNLYNTTLELKNFSEYLPRNDATIGMTSNLFKLVEDLNKRETISPVFCKLKLNSINKSAETIQQVIGNRPR